MSDQKPQHIGSTVLYGIVITLSVLVIIFSSLGVIGIWIIQQPLSEAVVSFVVLVEETASLGQQITIKVDSIIERAEEITTNISKASYELSGEVTDRGVVMVLLPEENELQLTDTINSAQETFAEIRAVIDNTLNLYQTVNNIPFVNLPGLSEDQLDGIAVSINETSEKVANLKAEIQAFRDGITERIDLVADATTQLTAEIDGVRSGLARLDITLAEVEALAQHLIVIIPGILIGLGLVLTIFFTFIIYTQVEFIRLYTLRWKQLGSELVIEEENLQIEPEKVDDNPDEDETRA